MATGGMQKAYSSWSAPEIWRRFSARLTLLAMLLTAAILAAAPHSITSRELWFLAAAAIYILWIPTRYLLLLAVGLLFLAALAFAPLKESFTDALLSAVYYILILLVTRELIAAILAPYDAFKRLPSSMAALETYHYHLLLQAMWWGEKTSLVIWQKTITTLRNIRQALAHAISRIGNILDAFALRTAKSFGIHSQEYSRYLHRFTDAMLSHARFAPIQKILLYALRLKHAIINLLSSALLHSRWAIFIILTAAVVLPWFAQSGYLFLLDYVWPPHLAPPTGQLHQGYITSLPHEWLFWLAAQYLPTDFVQKLALSLPLLLAGVSGSYLTSFILKRENQPGASLVSSLIAGTFYALNTFVVSRVFMGQIYLLYGYALMPWAVLATLRFMQTPRLAPGLVAGASVVAVMVSSAHHIILLPLAILPLFLQAGIYTRAHLKRLLIALIPVILFLSLFAAVLFRQHPSTSSVSLEGPWARLLQAPFSGEIVLDVLALTANWKTDLVFAFPHEVLPHFTLLITTLAAVMLFGLTYLWRRQSLYNGLLIQLLIIAAISIFLAAGLSHPLSAPLSGWLYKHVPFWVSMRDSGKFMANLALVESVVLGIGTFALVKKIPALPDWFDFLRRHTFALVLVIVMLIFVSPAYGGFGGQVVPANYPDSWKEWDDVVPPQTPKPTMLVLPWHMYPTLEFLEGRPVINPAAHFFINLDIIHGDNSEVGGIGNSTYIFSESTAPLSKKVEEVLRRRNTIENFGQILIEENISYIGLLADATDAGQYEFLRSQNDLQLVFESPELVVWRNSALRQKGN